METRNPPLGAFSRAVRVSWRMRDVPAGARAAPKVAKLPAPPRDRAVTDLKRLLTREGFSHVTLDRMLLVEAHRAPALEWMEAWLGPAAVVSDDGMRHGWRISSTAANPTPSAPAATESAD